MPGGKKGGEELWSGERRSEIQQAEARPSAPVKELGCVLKVMMALQFWKITSVFWEMDAGVEIK